MTEEQKYLLKNGCDDLVINEESRPEDWIYVSDIMERWKEKQLILSGVSQQRELLAFVKEVSEFDALVSSTRLRVKAKELLKANCG